MGSIPNDFIEDIKRIVQSVLNQLGDLRVRWLNGVDKINDAEWSAVNYGVTVCTSGTRPTAYNGRPIFETDTDKFLVYDGADWIEPGGFSATDHGALTGLADDDHTQYLNTARHDLTARHTLGSVVPHDTHSALSNLAWSVASHSIDADISPTSNQAYHLGSASNAFNTIYVDSLSNYTTDAQIECLKNFDMNAHDIYNVDGLYLNSGATTYIDDDASGNMELHVATGKTVKIVVG